MAEPSKKSVVWHTDVMALFSDTESCLICLTERQRYLLGQCLEQMRWQTRWIVADGDTLPDIDALASELEYKLMDCEDLCAEVLNCIQTDESIQQAIAALTNSVTISNTETISDAISNTDVLTEANIQTCNNDNLFGATTGIVDLMNELAEDWIEIMSSNSSIIGRVGDAIEGIPIIGEFPLDDVFQLVESFVDDMEQLYQANYTVATRDRFRCDLFCIAQDSCSITFEQIYDYFEAEFGSVIPTTSVQDFILWFATNSPANALIVEAWHLFIAGLMRFGGEIFNIDSSKVITMVSAMYNDPDADWATLCDCGWTSTLDLTSSDYGFLFFTDDNTNNIGQWVNGTGLVGTSYVISGQNYVGVYGRFPFDETTITEVTMQGSITEQNSGAPESYTINRFTAFNNAVSNANIEDRMTYADFATQTPTPFSMNDTDAGVTADELEVIIRPSYHSTIGSGHIHTITIKGTGTKPTQFP